MSEWIGAGKTPEDAFAQALKKSGLSPDQVEMKVLSDRTSGLLSMFGFRWVKVRIVEKARRFDRRDRGDRPDEFDRTSHSLEYRRGGAKDRRADRAKEETPARTHEKDRKGKLPAGRPNHPPEERRRDSKEPRRPLPQENKPGKSRPPKPPRPPAGGSRPEIKPNDQRHTPLSSVPPELLLPQWKTLLGWDDLAWDMKPVENHRLTVTLKTSHGEKLAGQGGRALEAFEYLFNMVSSGGDREKPWVSFRIAGFPSAEESRVVDKAIFAAFQVRRTAKPFHLDPMSPSQRRAVHQTLVNHPDVETTSEGEGASRHVVVRPKGPK